MKEDRIDQRGDFYEKSGWRERQREREEDIHARGKYWSVRANSWTLTFAPPYQNHVSPSCSAPLRHWSVPKPTNARRRRKCSTGIDYEPGHRPVCPLWTHTCCFEHFRRLDSRQRKLLIEIFSHDHHRAEAKVCSEDCKSLLDLLACNCVDYSVQSFLFSSP